MSTFKVGDLAFFRGLPIKIDEIEDSPGVVPKAKFHYLVEFLEDEEAYKDMLDIFQTEVPITKINPFTETEALALRERYASQVARTKIILRALDDIIVDHWMFLEPPQN